MENWLLNGLVLAGTVLCLWWAYIMGRAWTLPGPSDPDGERAAVITGIGALALGCVGLMYLLAALT